VARFFLSYARADAQFALRLAEDLRTSGFDVWVDQRDILPSQRWDRAIETALSDCAAVIVVLSPRSVASENVLDEVGYAIDRHKDVIPVLFEQCDVPIRINRLQRVDFTSDYQTALERCKSVLGVERPGQPARALDAEAVQRAEQELAAYLGPLASKLVEVDASQARDIAELYRMLALHILDFGKRARFLENAPGAQRPAQPVRGLDPEVVRRVARELTLYVASNIPDAGERAAFLQQAPAHSGRRPAVVFSRAQLEAVVVELTNILGPISRHVVYQASREAKDARDLYERVAQRVADADERATLLKRLQAIEE
jgi:hypothetical protein